MSKERYTSTEVKTILEEIRSDFRAVTEVVLPLREDMLDVKNRLLGVEHRLTNVEDAIRIAIPDHEKRITRLEASVRG